MAAVGITYFEKPSRDKNIGDCQLTGVKFERTFLKFATDNSPEIKDMLKIFQFQENNSGKFIWGFQEDNHLCKVCSLYHALRSSF